jgi:hypothetical protein
MGFYQVFERAGNLETNNKQFLCYLSYIFLHFTLFDNNSYYGSEFALFNRTYTSQYTRG